MKSPTNPGRFRSILCAKTERLVTLFEFERNPSVHYFAATLEFQTELSGVNLLADSHIHLFSEGFLNPPFEEGDLATYESARLDAGIHQALVVGYEGLPQFRGNNEYILGLSRALPWIHPLAFIDVSTPPTAEQLNSLRSSGFCGFSLYLPNDGPSLDSWSPTQISGMGHAAEGLIISINGSPSAAGRVTTQLSELASNGWVLISHVGSPGLAALGTSTAEARQLLRNYLSLAELPSVMVKLSGLYAIDRPYPHIGAQSSVKAVLQAFGAHRLVWGSDFSPALAAIERHQLMQIPKWLADLFDAPQLDRVLGLNLIEILDH